MIATDALAALTCRLIGGWALLDGAGWVADAAHWTSGSATGWDLHRWRRRTIWRLMPVDALYSSRGLAAMGWAQSGVGLWLVLGLPGAWAALLGLAALVAVQALRGAGNGADKMAQVVVVGTVLQLTGLRLHLPDLVLAGVLWTGGQLTIAYWASGITKLLLKNWRNGSAPRGALTSHSWGTAWTARVVREPVPAAALGWGVMLAETLFPLALLLPAPGLIAVLGGFLVFHLLIALVLGLNTYPLAFAAAYPAVLLLGYWLRGLAGLA